MISITVDGTDELIEQLTEAERVEMLRPPMVRSLARLQAEMAEYPSPPSGSTYRRTGNYGRSWTQEVEESGDGITGTLGNAVRSPTGRSYGPYVGDSEMQASVHRGRWTTDEQALTDNLDAIERDFANAVESTLD